MNPSQDIHGAWKESCQSLRRFQKVVAVLANDEGRMKIYAEVRSYLDKTTPTTEDHLTERKKDLAAIRAKIREITDEFPANPTPPTIE